MTSSTAKIFRVLSVTMLGLTSCGPAPFKPAKSLTIHPSSYSYEFNDQGCKTGKQSFATKDEYCSGLLDDERNNNCARSDREITYNDQCR